MIGESSVARTAGAVDNSGLTRLAAKIGYLSQIDIFRDLTDAEVARLESMTRMVNCERGQVLYAPRQTGEVLFLLKRGTVRIYRLSPEGRKLTLATLGPGSVFGEMSLVGQGMYDSFAEAAEESTLCAMTRSDVERLLLTKPVVALRFLRVLGEQLLEARRELEDLAFKGVPARLASLLLRLTEKSGDNTLSGLTHQELAEMAGTLRETTTEALNHFKGAGLIDIGRMRIVVLDREGLLAVAEGRPADK
jgi:CRP-like cAMP-binding protein